MLPAQPAHVELDADLEEQQDDPEIGQQLDLLTVRLGVLGQELEGDDADDEVADDGRQAQTARDVPEDGGGQEDGAELEDGQGRRLHGGSLPSPVGAEAAVERPHRDWYCWCLDAPSVPVDDGIAMPRMRHTRACHR